jgi:hypothetical protein
MDTFEALLEAIEQYAAAAAEYKSIAEKVPDERDYYCHR